MYDLDDLLDDLEGGRHLQVVFHLDVDNDHGDPSMLTAEHIFLNFQIRPVRSRYVTLDLCMDLFQLPLVYQTSQILGVVARFHWHAEHILNTSLR